MTSAEPRSSMGFLGLVWGGLLDLIQKADVGLEDESEQPLLETISS